MRGHMLRNLKATVQLSEGQRCRRCLLSLSLVIPFCSLHWCTSCIILLLWNSPSAKEHPGGGYFTYFVFRGGEGNFLTGLLTVQQLAHQNQSSSPWLDWIAVAVRDWYPTFIIQTIASQPHHRSLNYQHTILIIFTVVLAQLIIPVVMRRCAVQ